MIKRELLMSARVIHHGYGPIGHESGASVGRPYWIDGADLNRVAFFRSIATYRNYRLVAENSLIHLHHFPIRLVTQTPKDVQVDCVGKQSHAAVDHQAVEAARMGRAEAVFSVAGHGVGQRIEGGLADRFLGRPGGVVPTGRVTVVVARLGLPKHRAIHSFFAHHQCVAGAIGNAGKPVEATRW